MAPSRRIAGIVVALAALAVSGCSSNDAKRSDVVDAMTDAGLSREEAACVGDAFEDEFNQDQLNDLGAASSPEDFPADTRDTVDSILSDCVDESGSGGNGSSGEPSDEGGSTDSTEDADSTTTTDG
jgi:hypothetical protein